MGKEKTSFTVHKDVVCARSSFFRAACSERWATSPQISIELPEDRADVFNLYLNYVYSDTVEVIRDIPASSDGFPSIEMINIPQYLVDVYILADKLGDLLTANTVVDGMIQHLDAHQMVPPDSVIAHAMTKFSIDSPIARLFVDLFVHEAHADCMRSTIEQGIVLQAILNEILLVTNRLASDNRWKSIRNIFQRHYYTSNHKCRYYQHDNEHPRCGKDCVERKEG